MKNTATIKELSKSLIDGAKEGVSGTGILKIVEINLFITL